MIEDRLNHLGMEYAQAARLADVSVETLAKIRRGVRARPKTYRRIERVLGWSVGACDVVIAGGTPQLQDDGQTQRRSLPIFDDPIEQAVWDIDAPEDVRLYFIGAYRLRDQLQPLVDAWRRQQNEEIA
ncbi:XRE family transcriptional regulator [Nocardiopsis gilva YIM 90087]|uniref:XRE family transcriptional regulator n=1 Tax=Nocardiopsis gilva YIM 90087 TaxID=1235441 RepID=A0A223S0C4_9ACTN|nr:XRE family transcriptional regulator [Nocardiopsis gilva YIM 90087]